MSFEPGHADQLAGADLRIDGCCLVAQANPGDPYYDIIPHPG